MVQRATVLLVGTVHLDRPDNGDLFRPRIFDVFSDERQREIQQVAEVLQTFRPTEVALETLPEQAGALNADYSAYLKQSFTLTANERHQLGFRVARLAGLAGLQAVDWNQTVEGVPNLAELEQLDPVAFDRLMCAEQQKSEALEAGLLGQTYLSFLEQLNDKQAVEASHRTYRQLARLDPATHVGARWVIQYWYYRNLLIANRILDLAEPGERILVLYGAAHLPLIQQFLDDSGGVDVMTFPELIAKGSNADVVSLSSLDAER
ncbi:MULTISPECIES: DUF5694 domain-containing protein [unclassified Exiguobacterium]|uniref:DUF5694 domain-containing protein n=1 Tax=unclassified Exiguobacterium TaxID=2644629 RepID=UPI001BE6606D|nr:MULTISPECIES: DUF5694 domain-containing protein [unclassified Exiguobacterium]